MAFDSQGQPIIAYDEVTSRPIIGHHPTGVPIFGTFTDDHLSSAGSGENLASPTTSNAVPSVPDLPDEKMVNYATPVHDTTGAIYRKTPGLTTAFSGPAVPEIDELKSIVAGLLRSTQALADQATTGHDRHVPPSTRGSRPDKISPPRLGTHSSADPFALQRHLLALETYFRDALLHWSPGPAEHAWKISVANTSISQSGGRFTTWLELHGKHAETWDAWQVSLKSHILARGWESKLRHRFMQLRCLDTTPAAFDAFFHLVISYQGILHDFEDPLSDVDVNRRLLDCKCRALTTIHSHHMVGFIPMHWLMLVSEI